MVRNKIQQNPAKKAVKNSKTKDVKVRSEAEELIRKFLLILTIIIVIIIGVYFGTKLLVNNPVNETETSETGEINYDIVTVGTMLNKSNDEYYVLAYNSQDVEAIYYSSLMTKYQAKEKLNIYFLDLDNSLNEKYNANGGETNPKAKTIEELKLGKITLINVKNGKINKYIEDIEQIKVALQ